MMGLRSRLIPWRLTGQLNLHEPAFFNEPLEGAVDCGNAQTWSVRLRDLEHLLRTQRTTSFFDNVPDGSALASISFHDEMVHGIRAQLQYQQHSFHYDDSNIALVGRSKPLHALFDQQVRTVHKSGTKQRAEREKARRTSSMGGWQEAASTQIEEHTGKPAQQEG